MATFDHYYTAQEVAKLLNVSEMSLYRKSKDRYETDFHRIFQPLRAHGRLLFAKPAIDQLKKGPNK